MDAELTITRIQADTRRADDGRFIYRLREDTVRCECDSCGAHLTAAPGVRGELLGVCLVCGAEDFTPVD